MTTSRRRMTVVVAGLGAMGSSLAYHLSRRGARVIGLDRHTPPHTFGSSHGESRIIREAYFEDPAYVPLVRRAYAAWSDLEMESGAPLLTTTGALIVGAPDAGAVTGAAASARAHGIRHRLLDAAAIRAEFPQLCPRPHEVAVHEERAGVLRPERCIAAHLEGAVSRGAELRYEDAVREWEALARGAGVKVTTTTATFTADALVLAAGPWMPGLLPEAALEVERQVMVWFRPRANPTAFSPGAFPVFLWDQPSGVFYGVPNLGNGLKAARHHGGRTAADPAALSAEATPADMEPVRSFLSERVPGAAGEIVATSVCRYTNTSDGHFLVDRHPGQEAVWIASACSGHGFKFSSALGDAVAAEITTGAPDPDLGGFRWRTAVQRGF